MHRHFNPNVRNFLLSSVLAFLLVVGLSAPALAASRNESGAAEPNFCVMSFNIRYGTANDGENSWANRREMVCNVLRRYEPDVVGLQEALRFQIDDIRTALPEYAEIGVGRDDGKTGGEYSAILYKKDRLAVTESATFWLSDTPEVPGSITWGNACTRLCTWGRFIPKSSGKPFYMFNTHLDHVSQPAREKGIAQIMSRVSSRNRADPFILTGDFNSGENNRVVRYLKGEVEMASNGLSKNLLPLVDTFRVVHKDASDVGTAHNFKGGRAGNKIDYIFVQPGVEVLKAGILYDNKDNRYPSDHFPVMATLRLAGLTGD